MGEGHALKMWGQMPHLSPLIWEILSSKGLTIHLTTGYFFLNVYRGHL